MFAYGILVEVNCFKSKNERFGYCSCVGDDLLFSLTMRLNSCFEDFSLSISSLA